MIWILISLLSLMATPLEVFEVCTYLILSSVLAIIPVVVFIDMIIV